MSEEDAVSNAVEIVHPYTARLGAVQADAPIEEKFRYRHLLLPRSLSLLKLWHIPDRAKDAFRDGISCPPIHRIAANEPDQQDLLQLSLNRQKRDRVPAYKAERVTQENSP